MKNDEFLGTQKPLSTRPLILMFFQRISRTFICAVSVFLRVVFRDTSKYVLIKHIHRLSRTRVCRHFVSCDHVYEILIKLIKKVMGKTGPYLAR